MQLIAPVPRINIIRGRIVMSNKIPAQRGFTLIEALIALLILALGVLGLAQVQARMLAQTRTTNTRATAIRLIADLSDRIRINSTGTQTGSGLSLYSDDSANDFSDPADGTPNPDCDDSTKTCTSAQQAAYDVWAWRQAVKNTLPGGKASIWQIDPQQLQVVLAWQANEDNNADVASPLQITGADAGRCASGGSGFICHIGFIDIPTN